MGRGSAERWFETKYPVLAEKGSHPNAKTDNHYWMSSGSKRAGTQKNISYLLTASISYKNRKKEHQVKA